VLRSEHFCETRPLLKTRSESHGFDPY
jgi:hypothetical protein